MDPGSNRNELCARARGVIEQIEREIVQAKVSLCTLDPTTDRKKDRRLKLQKRLYDLERRLFFLMWRCGKREIRQVVLCGGGTFGHMYNGALDALQGLGLLDNVHTFVGTSVGAIAALLNGLRLDAAERRQVAKDVAHGIQKTLEYSLARKGYWLWRYCGVVDMREVLLQALRKCSTLQDVSLEDLTFDEVYERYRKSVVVCCANLSQQKRVYFGPRHMQLGPSSVNVIDAVAASCSAPLLMRPVRIDGDLYVDGGMVDNLPYSALPHEDIESTVGFHFTADQADPSDHRAPTMSLIEVMARNLMLCSDVLQNIQWDTNPEHRMHTIDLKVPLRTNGFDFSAEFNTQENTDLLEQAGRDQAEALFGQMLDGSA